MPASNPAIRLKVSPEARLVPVRGDRRFVDFHLKVDVDRSSYPGRKRERTPLSLGLVIDRSGSMSGPKLETAKWAALRVLERLEACDRVSLTVFDDRIDVVLPPAPVTDSLRRELSHRLESIEARGMTALHEGWLTGCHCIAEEGSAPDTGRPTRVFLLTDGLANVGQTDPETIAFEAAQVHDRTGITTSTFGIGADYDEGLLGPMAIAGGGQFHHLRHPDDIVATFEGELGALLDTVVTKVNLEIEAGPKVEFDFVSSYWAEPTTSGNWRVSVGDLAAAEERHVVVRLGLPPGRERSVQAVRARVTWAADGVPKQGEWQEVLFTYAPDRECEAESKDASVRHWAGLHENARARQRATDLNREGDLAGAADLLRQASADIAGFASDDEDLRVATRELDALSGVMGSTPLPSMARKELRFTSQTFARGQRDHRQKKRKDDDRPH